MAEGLDPVFIPLPKKGDLTDCGNYRTIYLVSHASKIFLSVIMSRIRNKVEQEISEEQAGFQARHEQGIKM